MPVVTLPNQRRRRQLTGPCQAIQDLLDQKLTVAETIAELEDTDLDQSDLAWLIANKKGKIKAWAKKELKVFVLNINP